MALEVECTQLYAIDKITRQNYHSYTHLEVTLNFWKEVLEFTLIRGETLTGAAKPAMLEVDFSLLLVAKSRPALAAAVVTINAVKSCGN